MDLGMDLNTLVALIAVVIVWGFIVFNRNLQVFYYRKNLSDLKELDSREFEFFCADYLACNGFKKVRVTQESRDGGKDIIAYKKGIKYVIECKRYEGAVGEPIGRKLHSVTVTDHAMGILMTTGHYTSTLRKFAYDNGIELIENNALADFYAKIRNN